MASASCVRWRRPAKRARRTPGLLLLLSTCCGPDLAAGRIGLVKDLVSSSFDSFIKQSPAALVDFFDPEDVKWPDDSASLQGAIRAARELGSKVVIGKVDVKKEVDLARKYVPNGPFPQLLWFKNGEPTQYHRSLRKQQNVVDFVLALDRNPIQNFNSEAEVKQSVNRAIWAQLPKDSELYRVLEVVASRHMDTLEVAFKEAAGTDIRWLEDSTDKGELHEPASYTGKADVDSLDHWVRSQLTRSEPLPEPQEGDSVAVVGVTFEDLVLQKDKDVFLLIYAPWCGFSRKFIPTWESFARHVARVPHLLVGKMDGDRNGSPFPEDFSWSHYPTVFFVQAGKRKPVVFHGNRSVTHLLEFAKEQGSKGLAEELEEAKTRAGVDPEEWEL